MILHFGCKYCVVIMHAGVVTYAQYTRHSDVDVAVEQRTSGGGVRVCFSVPGSNGGRRARIGKVMSHENYEYAS